MDFLPHRKIPLRFQYNLINIRALFLHHKPLTQQPFHRHISMCILKVLLYIQSQFLKYNSQSSHHYLSYLSHHMPQDLRAFHRRILYRLKETLNIKNSFQFFPWMSIHRCHFSLDHHILLRQLKLHPQ